MAYQQNRGLRFTLFELECIRAFDAVVCEFYAPKDEKKGVKDGGESG